MELALIGGLALGAVGTIAQMGAASQQAEAQRMQADAMRQQADTERQVAAYNAAEQTKTANEERAAAQRTALEQKRQTDLVQSKLQANAAASGGGASDPTVISLASDIEGQGTYQSLFSMYKGEARGSALEDQAAITRYSGNRKADAYLANADATDVAADATESAGFASMLGGFSNLFTKFAPKFA